jgi:hypothetical protein
MNGSHPHFSKFSIAASCLAVMAVATLQLAELSVCYPDISWEIKQFDRYESVYGVWIAQFSRFAWADTGVADPMLAEGILSYPWANFVLHGLSARLLGAGPGFLFAELLVALTAWIAWWYALKLLLPEISSRLPIALLAAAVTTSAFSSLTDWINLLADSSGSRPMIKYIAVLSGGAIIASKWIVEKKKRQLTLTVSCLCLALCGILFQPGEIYSDRFPRPFVSQLALIPGFALALRIIARANASRKEMILLAIFGGLTLHMDIYGLLALGLLSAVAILRCTINQGIPQTARLLLWPVATTFIFLTPFLYARLHESPDLPIRLGLRSGEPLYLHHFNFSVALAFLCVLLAAIALAKNSSRLSLRHEWHITSIWLCIPLSYLISSLLLPILTGKSIQMWHYLYLVADAFSLVFFLIGIATLSRLSKQLLNNTRRESLIWLCAITLLICASTGAWLLPSNPGERGVYNPSRQRLVSFQGENDDLYRILTKAQNFANGRELVLGSTDANANNFWSAWCGPVLTPDSGATTLSTLELAYRTALLYAITEEVDIKNVDYKDAFRQWIDTTHLGHHAIFHYSPQE